MATPRRRWFPVYTTLYRDAIPREWKLAIVMLGCLMVDRWASERLTDEQAARTQLGLGDQLEVTGCSTAEDAVSLLRAIAKAKAIRITIKVLGNGFVEINWPKLLDSLKSRRPTNDPLPPGYTPVAAPLAPGSDPVAAPSSSSSSERGDIREVSIGKKIQEAVSPQEKPGASRPSAASRHRSLLNYLSDYGNNPKPEPDERLAWFEGVIERVEAEAQSRLTDSATAKQLSGKAKSILIGWWQTYLGGDRAFLGIAERRELEAKKAAWQAEHGAAYRAAEQERTAP